MTRSILVALVRHGATAWTAEGRAQGRADPPLSPDGEIQVGRWRLPPDLAQLAAEDRLGWATSPLARAVATARRLGATAPRIEPRLLERDYGVWTGRPFAEIRDLPETEIWTARPPGGESLADVLDRVRGWLDDLARDPAPAAWIAVTHSGVVRALVAAAVGWDLREPAPLRVLPERLHRIRRRGDGHLQLLTLNEPLVAS